MATEDKQCNLLPHHEQKELCTTRLPYRQGRKLTAVKVYTINNESKHLLIFGVPSLNLRQETKALFMKFGKILQFNLTKYPSEKFTETYHVVYDSIQSARIAKKMLDTKNYYGGNLHICYAPELESIEDTNEKLALRKIQVNSRLKNLERESKVAKVDMQNKIEERLNEMKNIMAENEIQNKMEQNEMQNVTKKMYMGSTNIIINKRKAEDTKINKKIKNEKGNTDSKLLQSSVAHNLTDVQSNRSLNLTNVQSNDNLDVVDCTSANVEVISNINDALNYNKFGSEVIKQVPYKPINKIKFNLNKNT